MERQLKFSRETRVGLSRLYLIFDVPEPTLGRDCRAKDAKISSLARSLEAVLQAGVRLVQLRAKRLSVDDFLRLADELVPPVHRAGGQILLNTHAEVSLRTEADGVHRPAQGRPVGELRGGAAMRVGVSAHSIEEAVEVQSQGADFVTLSPIFETPSKPGYGPALGLGELRKACSTLKIPVYTLAGISPARTRGCLDAGAFGVAVMGGVMNAANPADAASQYLRVLSSEA